MRINTRFSVATHIMAVLAMNHDRPNTSKLLAKSVGTNPVVIRQLVSVLKEAGLVSTRNGIPGAYLTRKPGEITLRDIYNAVKKDANEKLFDFHANSNPLCYVGRHIEDVMEGPMLDAQRTLEQSLSECTLEQITLEIGKRARL